MRLLLTFIFGLIVSFADAQRRGADFDAIDERVRTIDAPTPDSLAFALTHVYTTDLEKTRAIFSWIAQHIEYNTGIFTGARPVVQRTSSVDLFDTLSVWRPGIEMAAWRVMQKKLAVCEGYAKLFKVLCDYAGLHAEVVSGYAKCYLERNDKFRTNHSWNAVMIDGKWYLLDMTWASGYINYANEYVQHLDENYFLTPPREFIRDHYPENLHWTLLEDPPALREFAYSPFRFKSFVKYGIHSYKPGNGTIEAAVGDTLQLELEVGDAEKNRTISSDPFFDSTMLTNSPSSVFLLPSFQSKKVIYTYVVDSSPIEWLNLIYNDDTVLRYYLNRR
jgi:transglutaminase/protease-like cytokinesis protein 3